jgi:Fe-S-cluster containining protein
MTTIELKTVNGIKIDPNIFTFKFDCNCKGECCYYGVYTDFNEYKKIISLVDDIIPLMDDTQSFNVKDWFEEPEKDEDFQSGIAVGTEIINGKCAFLDKDGLCVLQKLANIHKVHKWSYKPKYCILFPLTIYENTLTIDDEHIDRLKTCNKNLNVTTSIFDYCQEELKYIFGVEGFNELLKLKEEITNTIGAEFNGS